MLPRGAYRATTTKQVFPLSGETEGNTFRRCIDNNNDNRGKLEKEEEEEVCNYSRYIFVQSASDISKIFMLTLCVRMYVCMSVCMYVCMYVCVCMCVRLYALYDRPCECLRHKVFEEVLGHAPSEAF